MYILIITIGIGLKLKKQTCTLVFKAKIILDMGALHHVEYQYRWYLGIFKTQPEFID